MKQSFPYPKGKPLRWRLVYLGPLSLNGWYSSTWTHIMGSGMGRGLGFVSCQCWGTHPFPDPIHPSPPPSPLCSAFPHTRSVLLQLAPIPSLLCHFTLPLVSGGSIHWHHYIEMIPGWCLCACVIEPYESSTDGFSAHVGLWRWEICIPCDGVNARRRTPRPNTST